MLLNSSQNWKAISGLGAVLKRCDECGILTASIAMAFICIDAMANLGRPAEKNIVTGSDFIRWVDTYLKCHSEQPYEYRGKDVYAARCAFLHTYGSEAELHKKPDVKMFGYHDGTEHYYESSSSMRLVLIGTKSFVLDVLLAMKSFLEKCKMDSVLMELVEKRLPKFLQTMPLP